MRLMLVIFCRLTLLTHSFSAKAYAVRKVTTNKGKNTSGIDKKLWSTSASKMKAVILLNSSYYKTKPLKRVYIEKKGKKQKRPLGIPTMKDRAMPWSKARRREIGCSLPRERTGLASKIKKMYIKSTSCCLIFYQSIVGKLYTVKSEGKFTKS